MLKLTLTNKLTLTISLNSEVSSGLFYVWVVMWAYKRCESGRCNRSKWEYFQSSEALDQRSGAPLSLLPPCGYILCLFNESECIHWFTFFFSCCFLLLFSWPHSALSVFLRLVPYSSGSWASGCACRWHCPVWVLCRWLAHSKYHLGEGPGTSTCRTYRPIQVSYLGISF